jgi:hypothetical protein
MGEYQEFFWLSSSFGWVIDRIIPHNIRIRTLDRIFMVLMSKISRTHHGRRSRTMSPYHLPKLQERGGCASLAYGLIKFIFPLGKPQKLNHGDKNTR